MKRAEEIALHCDVTAAPNVLSTMTATAETPTGGVAEPAGFAQQVDAMILVRAQRGDMQAFASIYSTYGRACYGLALRLTTNAAQAEDLVQEVFLKLMENIRSYRGDAPFGAWLKRLTVNAAIDQLRQRKRLSDGDPEAVFAEIEVSDPSPAENVDAWAMLRRLSPRARTIVVLHQVEGYTHAEIATLFGQSESYSKSILSRALQRLQAAVAPRPLVSI
jgi:RNA polymerase sigma-70 factor (ECF subfamily)